MPACRYVEEIGLAAVLAADGLAGATQQLNLEEYITCTSLPSVNKAGQKGVSVSPLKDLCPSIFF